MEGETLKLIAFLVGIIYSKIMAATRILISDPLDPVCGNILKQKGVQFDQLKLTKEELLTAIKVHNICLGMNK